MDTGESEMEVKTFKVYRRKKRSSKGNPGSSGKVTEKGKQIYTVQAEAPTKEEIVKAVAGEEELQRFRATGESWLAKNMVNDKRVTRMFNYLTKESKAVQWQ